jgi:hypothetical protein
MRLKNCRSLTMSSFGRLDAAVRMMMPPVKPSASALLARLDLPRHAYVIDRRHEDEEAAGQRRVAREPGPFGAKRLLDDLDEDVLPLAQERLDPRLVTGRFFSLLAAAATAFSTFRARGV